MESVKWSENYQKDIDYGKKVNKWYSQALEILQEGKFTLAGRPINLNNPKEVAAVFYLIAKDYELFHEKF